MTRPGPYDPKAGTVHVLSEKCSTCIFRPGNLMDLESGQVKRMVEGSVADGAAITCHQTLAQMRPVYGAEPAMCRGFVDAHGKRVPAIRMAVATGVLVEDAPPTKIGDRA
jgi:hypothetical protein